MTDNDVKGKWERVKEAKKKVDGAKGAINTGAKVITDIIKGESFLKIVDTFADGIGFGGVFGLFKAIFGLDKEVEKEDPMRADVDKLLEDMTEVKRSLRELKEQVKQLSGLVSDGFNDMKAFITEQAFYLQVALSVDRLGSFLEDWLNDPSDNNTRDFLEECGRSSPRGHAYTILGLLNNDATNPLKMAMVGDVMKTRETFDKWARIIKEVLGHLLVLDYIYEGLREQQQQKEPMPMAADDLRKRLATMDALFDTWAKEVGATHWPQVARRLAEDALKTRGTRDEVARLVKDGLEKVMTADSFYLIVADDPYRNYTWNVWAKDDAAHYLPVIGDTRSVLVYRSVTGNERNETDLTRIKPWVENIGNRFDAVPEDSLINVDFFISEKFTVSSANSKFQWGPGWWIRKPIDNRDWTWIVGFK